jgi:hypothetical protein
MCDVYLARAGDNTTGGIDNVAKSDDAVAAVAEEEGEGKTGDNRSSLESFEGVRAARCDETSRDGSLDTSPDDALHPVVVVSAIGGERVHHERAGVRGRDEVDGDGDERQAGQEFAHAIVTKEHVEPSNVGIADIEDAIRIDASHLVAPVGHCASSSVRERNEVGGGVAARGSSVKVHVGIALCRAERNELSSDSCLRKVESVEEEWSSNFGYRFEDRVDRGIEFS